MTTIPVAREQGYYATARLDLMGEIKEKVGGRPAFQRGVTAYPAIGDPAALITHGELRHVYDVSGADTIEFVDGPAASAANFGSVSIGTTDFGSIKAAAQSIIDGGKSYAFVANGVDGYLFATESQTGATIADVVKVLGASAASSLQRTDIVAG